MKLKHLVNGVCILLLIVGASILFTGCEKETHTNYSSNKILKLQISFEKFYLDSQGNQQLLREWDEFISGNDITISQIERDVQTPDEEFLYGGGKVFEDNNSPKTLSEAISLHAGFQVGDDHVIQSLQKQVSSLSVIPITDRTAQQSELLDNLLRQLQEYSNTNNRVLLKSMVILLNKSVYEQLKVLVEKSNGSVKSMEDVLYDLNNKSIIEPEVELRDATNWTPDYGTIETYAISSTKRTVVNNFTWTAKPFPSQWYTYEHDFFLNNYSSSSLPGTYLSRSTNSSGFPICDWYSNLPYKYLDTRLFDENTFEGTSNEVPYTIGCGEGYSLQKNVNYWTQIITNNGNANSDNAKLFAQKGTQIPTGCTSVWCSFSAANKTILSAWTIGVPGSLSWSL